jgi:hypothetical protein
MLRATIDSLLDRQVLLEAVRDEADQIVDFVFADANPAACEYNQKTYDELIGMGLLDRFPNAAERLVLDDYIYPQELFGG